MSEFGIIIFVYELNNIYYDKFFLFLVENVNYKCKILLENIFDIREE